MQVRFGSQARPRVPVRQFFENTASTLKFGPHARFLIQARLKVVNRRFQFFRIFHNGNSSPRWVRA
jgi:hypothetical protein